jgi:hypothetical protein
MDEVPPVKGEKWSVAQDDTHEVGADEPKSAGVHPLHLLTSEQVERIRLREEAGDSIGALAREFGVAYEIVAQYLVRRW